MLVSSLFLEDQEAPCAILSLPGPGCFGGTWPPSPAHLLVRLCPAGHVSPYPQLVHLYAARKRQLDLIFAWKKRVFLWTSNNELRATSLMHSPSKYALSGNALPTPASATKQQQCFAPKTSPNGNPFPCSPKVSAKTSAARHAVCAVQIAASSPLLLETKIVAYAGGCRGCCEQVCAARVGASCCWGLASRWRGCHKGHFHHSKPRKARGCYGSGETLSLSLSLGVSLWCSVRSAAHSISALPCA